MLPTYLPSSVHLARLLDGAEGTNVPVGWVIERLGPRSFGLILVVMALLAFLPGMSTFMGVLIAWPAVQMILGHDAATIPRAIARRRLPVERLARAIRFVAPRLAWVERFIRPRWPTPFRITRRLTGLVMLLLGVSMISPVPFLYMAPTLVVMVLALAYLEEDGVALMVALTAALLSLAATGASVWGVVETADWLDPASPRADGVD